MKLANTLWLLLGLGLLAVAGVAAWWVTDDVPSSLPRALTPRARSCAHARNPDVIELELAGTADRAREVVRPGVPCTRLLLRESLRRDPVFILTYVPAIAWFCAWGARRLRSGKLRALGWIAIGVTVVAALLDLTENALLDEVLSRDFDMAPYATAASLAKWALLLVPIAYAAGSLVALVLRLLAPEPGAPTVPDDDAAWQATARGPAALRQIRGLRVEAMMERWWWATRPPSADAWDQPSPGANTTVGVAYSGGGIRSASFHLGVTETCLDARFPRSRTKVLHRARYLATVSGGGYLGIARQITLHAANDPPVTPPAAADAFCAGSPEQRFVIDHRRYLWDTTWLRVLGMLKIVLGLAINVALFGVLLYLAARPLGWAVGSYVFEHDTSGTNELVLWLTAVALGLATAVAFSFRGLRSVVGAAARAIATCFGVAAGALALVATTTVSGWMTAAALLVVTALGAVVGTFSGQEGGQRPRAARLLVAIPGILLATGAAVVARWWVLQAADHGVDGDASLGALPIQIAAALLILLTLGTLAVYLLVERCPALTGRGSCVAGLLALALVASWYGIGTTDIEVAVIPETIVWGVLAFVAAATFLWVDQRKWSPHVFYKKRLLHTFSPIRAGSGADQLRMDVDTHLDEWARPVKGQPEMLVCASVALPGTTFGDRPAGSFTFTHEVVGGPDVGWVRTTELRSWLRGRASLDVTLGAGMAISGAAIASANGYMRLGSVNALLSLLNARLGVWLPNPTHIHELQERLPPLEGSRVLVRHRNIGYSLKEVFGAYDPEDRFVYVSDGGHHDNLGLIELLRRRCRVILSFDASGDKQGTVNTFTQVAERAQEELGVQLDPLDKARHAALLRGDARVGAYRIGYCALDPPPYVEGPSFPAQQGLLVFAKGIVLEAEPEHFPDSTERVGKFPRDSTASQWFSETRMLSYRALGRDVATEALDALADSLPVIGW